MTYIFPTYLAISVSTVTVMNTDTNQGTSFFPLSCFLEVMNFNVYVSKRPKQCQVTQHRIRRHERYPNPLQSCCIGSGASQTRNSALWCSGYDQDWVFPHIERFRSQTLTPVSSVILGSHQTSLYLHNGKE